MRLNNPITPKVTSAAILTQARVIACNALTQHRTTTISTEALSVNFVHKKLVQRLHELWGTASGFIDRLFTNTPTVLSPSLDLAQAIRVASKNIYLNDSDIKVTVPMGLDTDYLTYLRILDAMCDAAIDFHDNTLVPFRAWVGEVLNTPSKIESVRGHSGVKVFDPADLLKNYTKCFKGNVSTVKYGNAFNRNADWQEIQDVTNNILRKMSGSHSPVVVNEAVKSLDKSIGLLIDALLDPQKTYVASPRNIEALSMLCANLAKMIEFYGVTCYAIQTVAVTLTENAKHYVSLRD